MFPAAHWLGSTGHLKGESHPSTQEFILTLPEVIGLAQWGAGAGLEKEGLGEKLIWPELMSEARGPCDSRCFEFTGWPYSMYRDP